MGPARHGVHGHVARGAGAKAVEYGSQIHPQYPAEFDNGVAVAWHRSPFTMGCFGMWTEEARAQHYENCAQIDGRIVLAGEHASLSRPGRKAR